MVMIFEGNSVGSVYLAGALVAEEAGVTRSPVPKNRNCFVFGLLKVIRSDNWRTKAAIAQGSFIV
jgi:hypothetical protein